MSMKIKADWTLCSGRARCAAVPPDIFTLSNDAFVEPYVTVPNNTETSGPNCMTNYRKVQGGL
jgi:ferredoxin